MTVTTTAPNTLTLLTTLVEQTAIRPTEHAQVFVSVDGLWEYDGEPEDTALSMLAPWVVTYLPTLQREHHVSLSAARRWTADSGPTGGLGILRRAARDAIKANLHYLREAKRVLAVAEPHRREEAQRQIRFYMDAGDDAVRVLVLHRGEAMTWYGRGLPDRVCECGGFLERRPDKSLRHVDACADCYSFEDEAWARECPSYRRNHKFCYAPEQHIRTQEERDADDDARLRALLADQAEDFNEYREYRP